MKQQPKFSAADNLDAVRSAKDSLETILRLEMIQRDHGSLTASQETDQVRAIQEWNNAATVVRMDDLRPLDPIHPGRLDAETLGKQANIVRGLEKYTADQVRGEQIRSQSPTYDAIRGLSSGTGLGSDHGADEIRSMFDSDERQHDFNFLESEAIRGIPFGEDFEQVRAISDFANGSSLYVSDFMTRVAFYARTASPWIGLANVVTSENGRPMVVPKLTGDVTVYTPGEGTAITPSDPTLANVTITPVGFKALTVLSRESFDDAEYNLSDLLARSHARAIGLAFGSTFTTTVLAGINNGGTATGIGGNGTGTATFVGYEDLLDLKYSRAAPYRANGRWIMSNGMIRKGRKYKDAQGQYLWPAGGVAAGQPDSLDGHGVYEDPALAAPASATKSVVYGDLLAGLIIKASPLRVELSTDYLFNSDQVAIKTVQRLDGAVQDPAALAYLVSANA
jgi:HK97 family phage major capsid protein